MLSYLTFISLLLWVALLCVPWQPWRTREQWDTTAADHDDLGDVTVLIPARNESEVIADTIRSVLNQGTGLHIIVIDDNSGDGTGRIAKTAGGSDVTVIEGEKRPEGWSGKLWALEQARKRVETPVTMLLDADIKLNSGVIPGLRERLRKEPYSMLSLMVRPSLNTFWEILLMPAFIYFFKLLYPFRLANSESRLIAAAAGGCMIMETRVLEDIGGFSAIKDALIDDCSLARKIKESGYRTWVGLTHSAESIRPYGGITGLWDMVARTAYTQLRYSPFLLLLCTVVMLTAYWVPLAGLVTSSLLLQAASGLTLCLMFISYLPTLAYYNRNRFETVLLPFTATLYLAMTWTSAVRYWRGERMRWRGRVVKRG